MKMILATIAYILLGYFAICLLAYIFQAKLVFFPSSKIILNPKYINLVYEDLEIITEDNIRLHGWYIPSRLAQSSILICHGNAGNISHRLETIAMFHALNCNVLIFDYRGYGQSDGTPSENGTYLDAKAAFSLLHQKNKDDSCRLFIFGRSLGSGIAAWLASNTKPDGVILESSFTTLPELGQQVYPFLPVKLLSRIIYPVSEYLPQITAPILFIHSKDDEIIPPAHGQENFTRANDPKRLLIINGSHNEGFMVSREIYLKGIESFFSDILSGKIR